jgi:hypothetical protein
MHRRHHTPTGHHLSGPLQTALVCHAAGAASAGPTARRRPRLVISWPAPRVRLCRPKPLTLTTRVQPPPIGPFFPPSPPSHIVLHR